MKEQQEQPAGDSTDVLQTALEIEKYRKALPELGSNMDRDSSSFAATKPQLHPLWSAFLRFDRRRHCGTPDMADAHDLECWEAFLEGTKHANLPTLS